MRALCHARGSIIEGLDTLDQLRFNVPMTFFLILMIAAVLYGYFHNSTTGRNHHR